MRGPSNNPSNSTAKGCSVTGTGVNHNGMATCAQTATSALPTSTIPAPRAGLQARPGVSARPALAASAPIIRFIFPPWSYRQPRNRVSNPVNGPAVRSNPLSTQPSHANPAPGQAPDSAPFAFPQQIPPQATVYAARHASPPRPPPKAARQPKRAAQSPTSASAQLTRRIPDSASVTYPATIDARYPFLACRCGLAGARLQCSNDWRFRAWQSP